MLEREHKYDVDDRLVLPDLTGIDGVHRVTEPVQRTLQATYFDTPDHRLASVVASLRRRTGGDEDGWHLKLRSADDPRFAASLARVVRLQPEGPFACVPGWGRVCRL